MARGFATMDELVGFVGEPITEECLLGRGYFHCVNGKIVSKITVTFRILN